MQRERAEYVCGYRDERVTEHAFVWIEEGDREREFICVMRMGDGEKISYQSFNTSTKQQSSCCYCSCRCNSINRSRWMILSFRIMPKNFVIHQKNRHLLSVRCSAVFVDRAFAFASYHFASVRSISIHSIWLASVCVCVCMYAVYALFVCAKCFCACVCL